MPLYGRLEPFEGDGSAWPVYEEQVHVFFRANDTPEAKQRDIFLASCGTRVFSLLLDLLKPATSHVKTLGELLATLRSHFSLAPSTLMELFRFNNRSRQDGETLGQFVAALRGLASTCAFNDQLDSLLRDRFVCGINNPAMQTRLLELPDPSLDNAVKAALAMEAAAKDASEIARAAGSPSTEAAVNKMATRSGACSRCGAAHSPSQCQFVHAQCFTCGRTGHLALSDGWSMTELVRPGMRGRKPRPRPDGGVADELGKESPKLVLTPPFTGAAWVPCCSFSRGTLSTEQEREARSSLGGDLREGAGAAAAGLSLDGGAARVPPPGAGGSCCCPCRGAGAPRSAAKVSGETCVALDSERGAGPLRTTSAKLPFDTKENRFFASEYEMFSFTLMARVSFSCFHKGQDSRLREAGAEVVYCLTRGAPKGPNLPRARLNHQDALFPGHGKATHSQTWAGEPAWLGVRGDATHKTPAFTGGSFVTAKSFTTCIDSQPVVHTSSPCQAFKLVFFAHFAFNVVYRKEASLCLEFMQRDIAAVNPGKGTKVQRTKSKQHCLTPKVAALVTALPDYDF
ncbi:uncharacterized protein ISCGN_028394 [Ixodes scapularis]